MKQKIAELEKFGVKEADLTVMEQDADKAIEMIREVDSLREEVTRKLQAANEQLNSLRDRAAVYRKIILTNQRPGNHPRLSGLVLCRRCRMYQAKRSSPVQTPPEVWGFR